MPKKKKRGIGSCTLQGKNDKMPPPPFSDLSHTNNLPNHNPSCSIPKAKLTPKQLQRHINTLKQRYTWHLNWLIVFLNLTSWMVYLENNMKKGWWNDGEPEVVDSWDWVRAWSDQIVQWFIKSKRQRSKLIETKILVMSKLSMMQFVLNNWFTFFLIHESHNIILPWCLSVSPE